MEARLSADAYGLHNGMKIRYTFKKGKTPE